MEVIYKGGALTYRFQAETVKDAFRTLADIQSVFERESECGCCGESKLHFQVRITGKGQYDYYELVCLNPKCGATLGFGQTRDNQGLFLRPNKALPNRGWKVWKIEPQETVPEPPVKENAW
jgi:hypothetical protein